MEALSAANSYMRKMCVRAKVECVRVGEREVRTYVCKKFGYVCRKCVSYDFDVIIKICKMKVKGNICIGCLEACKGEL